MEHTKTKTEIQTQPYLTFSLGKEMFALNVDSVKEILELSEITEVPQSPHFMRGILNLRGNVLPVIDTRIKFGMPPTEDTLKTRVIVIDIEGREGSLHVGAVVDVATEVMEIDHQEILPPPSIEDYERAEYIDGVIQHDKQFIMILNAQKLFGSSELSQLDNAQNFES